jgi:putative SOS response-associated peptidase YedK
MCGRYRLTAKERYIRDHFGLHGDPQWEPRWNIAPSQQVAIVRQKPKQPGRTFSQVRWGLIPFWAKNPSFSASTINAASETAAEKPAFKEPLRQRRCLIPADGFYEWQRLEREEKQPFNIGLADGSLFSFAGLWDRWRDPGTSSTLETCTILTTKANALVSDVHHRMPVILPLEQYEMWLDPGFSNAAEVTRLLVPFDHRLMRKYPVSTFVNRPENDGPECAQEIAPVQAAQQQLFGG